jgi:hypothetical protein
MAEREKELMFESIGRLTVAWALLESALDVLIVQIHSLGGREIEPNPPWALKRKLQYVRRCFKDIAILASYAHEAVAVANEIGSASKLRHDIVHGTAQEHPEGATQIAMVRFLRLVEPTELKHCELSAPQILSAARHANQLGARVLSLGQYVFDIIATKEGQ